MTRRRRRPRYSRFLGTGVLVGLAAAFVAARLAPRTDRYEWTDVLLYLGLLAGLVGGLLGGLIAVLLDGPAEAAGDSPARHRWSRRGSRSGGGA